MAESSVLETQAQLRLLRFSKPRPLPGGFTFQFWRVAGRVDRHTHLRYHLFSRQGSGPPKLTTHIWHQREESNPGILIWRQTCYHYITLVLVSCVGIKPAPTA